MARIWKERRKPEWSEDFHLHGYQGLPGYDVSPDPHLVPVWVYHVHVCGFTFRFGSVVQIRAALDYFSRRIHPSTRLPDSRWLRSEHTYAQRWFERLPGRLKQESKRQKVVKALQEALNKFGDENATLPKREPHPRGLPLIKRYWGE